MAKFVYNGEQELVFPTIGVTVSKGDVFDAPDGFKHPDCVPAPTTKTQPSSKEAN